MIDHRIRGRARFVKNRFSNLLGRSTTEVAGKCTKIQRKRRMVFVELEKFMTTQQEKCCAEI